MSSHHPTRRALLKTLGAAAFSLPFFRLLENGAAWGQTSATPPQRLLVFFTPQGAWHPYWRPQGGEYDWNVRFTDSTLAALDPPIESGKKSFRDKVLILDGLDYRVLYEKGDTGHEGGPVTFLTGSQMVNERPLSASLDQVLAGQFGGATRYRSVNLGVKTQWMVGAVYGTVSFTSDGGRVFAEDSPLRAYQSYFAAPVATPTETARLLARRRSVLDYVARDLTRMEQRLTGAERVKLQQHLEAIRDLERQLGPGGGVACEQPLSPPQIDYDRPAPSDIPAIAKAQIDLMAQLFACDLTRFGTLQLLSAGDHYAMPWLNFDPSAYGVATASEVDPHGHVAHGLSATSAKALADFARMQQWYTDQFVYLLERLDSIPEGDGSVLDHTLVLWGNELGAPASHQSIGVPFVLAGNARGQLRTGRYLRFATDPARHWASNCSSGCALQKAHNHLLVSIAQAFGMTQQTFGDPDYSGPLAGLT